MNNIVNQTPYLRTSRNFPAEVTNLSVQVNKSYVDIANAVNYRTIGIFSINRPAVNGENWFISGTTRQQGLRQVYNISNIPVGDSDIPHGLDFDSIDFFTNIYGIGYNTAANLYFPIQFVNASQPTGHIEIYVTSTTIHFKVGAMSPTINSGIIVLEWITNTSVPNVF